MGKFSDSTCEELYDMSLDGCLDGECGNAADSGWYGLLLNTGVEDAEHAILFEDGQGFVDYETFDSEQQARVEFERIEEEIAEEEDEGDSED
jgi:hypothetical protein